MRIATLTGALTLALMLPPGAAGYVADRAVAPPAPEAVHPVEGKVGYGEEGARFGGPRAGRVHAGQDVFAPAGTPLLAIADSVVIEVGSDGGRGNHLALYSRELDRTFLYYHLHRPARVRSGERVRAGDRVGEVGCTGSCWGDHLHLEVHRGRGPSGEALDPLPLLRRWAAQS